jgi:hypothetical protein
MALSRFLAPLVLIVSLFSAGTALSQSSSSVEINGRGFSPCVGCHATIYLYNGKWYFIEEMTSKLIPLSGVTWLSKDLVVYENQYHCSWASLTGPRRPVTCTKNGWKDL